MKTKKHKMHFNKTIKSNQNNGFMTSIWGTQTQLGELLALANKHELKHSVEAISLANAQQAHERLIAGTVAGRIALVP